LLCVLTHFFTASLQNRADTAATEANTTFENVSEKGEVFSFEVAKSR
jgi:hypothetical protein